MAAVCRCDCHFAVQGFVGRCAGDGVEVLRKGSHFLLLVVPQMRCFALGCMDAGVVALRLCLAERKI